MCFLRVLYHHQKQTRPLVCLVLPQIMLPDSGKRGQAAARDVLRRCSVFLSGHHGELLRDLETSHDAFASKGRRKPKPGSPETRAEEASKMIRRSHMLHSVSRAKSRMLGFGWASVDDPTILQHMRDKHPPGRGFFDPYVQPTGDSDLVGLSLTASK